MTFSLSDIDYVKYEGYVCCPLCHSIDTKLLKVISLNTARCQCWRCSHIFDVYVPHYAEY